MNRYEREAAASKVEWDVKFNSGRVRELEHQVAHLTRALEYHVGTSLEIILAEERLLKLKIAEQKALVEETGSADQVEERRHYQDPQPGQPVIVDQGGVISGQSPKGV